jgi:hypothetical protein
VTFSGVSRHNRIFYSLAVIPTSASPFITMRFSNLAVKALALLALSSAFSGPNGSGTYSV